VAAGPAVSSASIADLCAAQNLPCADFGLLVPLKKSAVYGSVRRRVADPKPVDAWQAEELHYFLFELRPADNQPAAGEPPYALFTMRAGSETPASASVISCVPGFDLVEVADLLEPDRKYTVRLK
jgi:hypothetical protein